MIEMDSSEKCRETRAKVQGQTMAMRLLTVQQHRGNLRSMPTISMFYGILIKMFFRDTEQHHAPHIHAEYQGQVSVYCIESGEVLAGRLPPNKHKLVVAWIEIHHDSLLADWKLAAEGKPIFTIRGLDA